jgi:hypothetical protein
MKLLAYLLAIFCVVAAIMYFTMAAGSLPTFMPGYAAGSSRIHTRTLLPPPLRRSFLCFSAGWPGVHGPKLRLAVALLSR